MENLTGWIQSPLISLVIATTPVAHASAAPCQAEILQSYPNGTWLENMAQDRTGRLYYSVTTDKKIEVYEPGKGTRHFASLPIYPMGIAVLEDRLVIAGNRRPMSDGVAALQSNAITEVSLSGEVGRTVDVPAAKMLNGVVLEPGGTVLVADSRAGTIWRYDPASGTVDQWLKDELLGLPAEAPSAAVGANGLKLLGKRLLISNSGLGAILQVDMSSSGLPLGPISVLHKIGIVDDFDVASDGSLFVAPYNTTILRVSPSGVVDLALASGAEGATAVSLIGDRANPSAFYVTTTGNLLFGGKEPAKLLRVDVPGRGGCGPVPHG